MREIVQSVLGDCCLAQDVAGFLFHDCGVGHQAPQLVYRPPRAAAYMHAQGLHICYISTVLLVGWNDLKYFLNAASRTDRNESVAAAHNRSKRELHSHSSVLRRHISGVRVLLKLKTVHLSTYSGYFVLKFGDRNFAGRAACDTIACDQFMSILVKFTVKLYIAFLEFFWFVDFILSLVVIILIFVHFCPFMHTWGAHDARLARKPVTNSGMLRSHVLIDVTIQLGIVAV